MPNVSTLVDLLQSRARSHPDRTAYIFLLDGESESARLTYGELDTRARAIAARLQKEGRGGEAGERCLLLFPPGLEFVEAFFGCLYAGVIAVPAYPPRPGREQPRLEAIASDARPRFALTTAAIAAKVPAFAAALPAFEPIRWLVTEELPAGTAEEWREPELAGDTLAFLQYTSGSTATPKGVEVSHGNLLAMEELIRQTFVQDEESVIVGWLPVYHDMGLIGNVLQPLYLGASCVLMSPVAFLRRPRRWLEAIHRYRATTSGGPNFAYDLCVDRIAEADRAELDLSSWKVAFNGAEPVRAATLERFAAAFAPHGFRREAFQPCYGLAEATLLVSGVREPGGPSILEADAAALEDGRIEEAVDGARGRTLAGSGRVPDGLSVEIVDPGTLLRAGPGRVGELWVEAGPAIPRGYWSRPEATREAFEARFATGEGPYLRTGDLGFFRGGRVYITGRLKDLIILRGRNHYPQDLELTAERSAPGLATAGGAAFSVEAEGEERLVLAQELAPRLRPTEEQIAELAGAIRRAVAEEHEVQVWDVVLLRAGALPKTSSGKVQRSLCRRLYLDGELDAFGHSRIAAETPGEGADLDREALLELPPEDRAEALEAWLRGKAAEVLRVRVEDLAGDRPLIDLGLDSLAAIELGHAVEAAFGVELPVSAVLEGAGVRTLTERLALSLSEPERDGRGLPLPRSGGGSGRGLSLGQRGLWFLHRLDPAGTAYHLTAAARLRGDVPAAALRVAFQTLVDRHEALRSTFRADSDGEPLRIVHPAVEVDFTVHDATGWDDAELHRRIEEAAFLPFDLERGPLFRISLFEHGLEDRSLVLSVHHIAADFWSFGILTRDLSLALSGVLLGPAPRYGEFVHWQTDMLAGPAGKSLQSFWDERLRGLPVLDLPFDRPRAGEPGSACRMSELGPELTDRLRALSREQGATLFATLLAAFQALLHRYSGQTGFAVGSPVAGRPSKWPGRGNAVGYFTNPLVLRADLSGDPDFSDLLARTWQRVLEALDHADLPLPLLVERLRSERRNAPLFRALLVLHRPLLGQDDLASFALGEGGGRLDLGPISLESLPLPPRSAQFDLDLHLGDRKGSLGVALGHDPRALDGTAAGRLLGHFATLLTAIVTDPTAPLSSLPLLSAAEESQLLAWNATATPYPATSIPQLFAEQAARTPNAPALTFEGETLSYGQLAERVSWLAHRLQDLGVGPEVRVGVALERSLELVVALLAVLEAGGAYVPLDLSYPDERLGLLLADTGAPAVLTLAAHRPRLAGHGAEIVCLDEKREPAASARPPAVILPESAAYVIYTSGSTGKPKGVVNTHNGITNRLLWMQEVYGLDASDTVLQKTPFTFDVSVWEFFWPLITGARLVVARPGGHRDPAYLLRLIRKEKITTVHFVPSMLQIFVEEPGVEGAGLERVVASGEALPADLARRFFERLPGTELHNLYGPTEAAVDVTAWACEPGMDAATVPIGRPIANLEIHIVDSGSRPVPVGLPGELNIGGIGGAGLARGYLKRPDLTAERFVPHAGGERLYRTGDLARFREDGAIEYLGRLDHQVKIRGFRVEPGEVEAALALHPEVREAAVLPLPDGSGLAAYFVATAGSGPSPADLRDHLLARLPEHLVPSAWIRLDALPLTANGKLDRKALARIEPERPADGAASAAPRGPVEELLAALWAELLGRGPVGREDDFFASGGHSLSAARIVARVRQAFGVELPLNAVFEAPTPAALARRIGASRGAAPDPIRRASREVPPPLSFAQERLWFLDHLQPGLAAYNMPLALDLRGPFDPAALGAALDEIVRRHEVLRTTFSIEDDRPAQRIHPPAPVPIVDIELEAGGPVREAARPFDLEHGPLFRAGLLRLGSDDHRLLLTFHHTVADGVSLEILLAELGALYGGGSLPEPPLQFADYAAWEREHLTPERLAPQLAYWESRLAGAPALELPADRPRPALRSLRGGSIGLELSGLASVSALARGERATLFLTLLAAFEALLFRYTGQTDLVLGTPVAQRSRTELEPLIGPFVNTLVLRTAVSAGLTFRELLAEIRRVALEAVQHSDLPFEALVDRLRPERSLGQNPFFQVTFALQQAATTLSLPGGLTVEAHGVETGTAKFDLSLSLLTRGDRLSATLEYAADLFDPTTAARLLGQLETLLSALDPGLPLGRLPLLSSSERHQLLVEWNATEQEGPFVPVHERFERQALATPDALAVSSPAVSLTYAELNDRADRLAGHLLSLGLVAEDVVGVLAERSADKIAGALAVLKAGGAYAPLDPSWPEERLAYVLADARMPFLLAQSHLPRPHVAAQTLLLDLAEPAPASTTPRRATSLSSLAYVIYTSGSTGTPKGVALHHAGLANLIDWHHGAYTVSSADRATQIASVAFDASVWEIWPYLTAGASLHIPPDETRLEPAALARWLDERRITLAFLPTPLAEVLLDEPAPASLRALLTGGDRLHRRPSAEQPFALVNHYGPTEGTVVATAAIVLSETDRPPSIGRPIANVRAYVLDPGLEPAPIGVPGELFLGGAGLARGYLHKPDLTAETFLPDPFGSKGGRLYRTGDLVRALPDGRIEFLRRIDHQVKVKGFRIELGEIESVLRGHASVREAVVLAREDHPGEPRLVACVAPRDGELQPAELRAFLRGLLPEYMVPAVFVSLEILPLNPSGKIDRTALARLPLAFEEHRSGAGFVAPRDPIEETLAAIWSDVLRLDRIGAHDSFFDLGGHSLLATQVTSRVRSALGIDLPLRALFEAPTLADLAEAVRRELAGGAVSAAPPLVPDQRRGPAPLSFAQQRLWLLDQLEPGSVAYNLPVALRLSGELNPGAMAAAIAAIVERQDALRTTFSVIDGEAVQILASGGSTFPIVDLSVLEASAEEEARRIGGEEALRPFDLERGPLFRPLLLRLAPDDHVLAATMHHIISDGWSMGVLLRELGSLYAGERLPALPVQYPDFARWQRSWLQGETLAHEIEHWRRRLEGMPPFLELPADRPRPAVRTSAGASHPFTLSPDLSVALRGLARSAGTTPFMVAAAAFQAMLSRLSRQRDFGLGIPIAGRNRLEIEGLIGFFVNSLVLRADLSGGPSFGALLERVRAATLDAYAHQDLSFEKLVEELAPERSLAHTPLFQVMLAWQGALPPVADVFAASGLRAEPFLLEEETAKLDLTLSLGEDRNVFTGRLDYSRDLFDGATIDRFGIYLSTLLTGAFAGPETPLADLSLLPQSERRQVLEDWSASAPAAPSRRVHELFEEQAEHTPDAIALVSEAGALTYRELEERAESLAIELRSLAVGPENVIGLCAGRTPELIVGMLGILKSGAAYLPLDPAYPKERLAFLIEDSGAELILAEERWRDRLPEGIEIVGLGRDSTGTSPQPARDAWIGTASVPENLAYILHTSGSTGRPKGVMVSHGGIGNLAAAQIAGFDIRPGDRILQFASPSFDASVSEIWTALLAGAELHLADPGRLTPGPGGLQDLFAERRITHVTLPPPVLAALPGDSGSELRTLVVAGESCPPELIRAWSERTRVIDAYGPTEATVCATAGEADLATSSRLSIGRPIAGAEVRVLGPDLDLLPVGAPGELCLGGAGLARGYRGQPGLTAERFVPDPFGEPGARLYRTGDLGRWLPDGRLDFLGRIDAQVKIRGFRIEPGEIEAVLASHPAVREAAVIPREDALTAYVVAEAPAADLRAWLAERLPAHLVPSAVVSVPSFPLTPNGKVDRRALAAIEPDRPDRAEPPRGFLEETLAAIYAEVLRLPAGRSIGRTDSFFELGGHSLLATQVTSRLRTAFGVELPLRAVFEAPSLAALAERIAEARGATEAQAPPLVPVARAEPAPLSFAQGRLWFLAQLEPGSTAYNLPLAVRLDGALDVAALGGALAGIAARHEPLRTTFPVLPGGDGEPVQRVGEWDAGLPLIDLSGLGGRSEEEGGHLAEDDARRPFDLESGPLFRPLLLRLAPEAHLLLATMHHIASDGWSMGVFVREVAALYRSSPLPPLPIQYRDYAVWQRRRLAGERLAAEVDFWRGELAGLPPRLELPADRPRPPVRSLRGGRRAFHLAAETAAALRSAARAEGSTLFMILLAGFQALLGRLSGQDDLAVGTPVAGRTRTELEGLIGFFVNSLVLRADLARDPDLPALLARVRERALAAQAHQELPFEKLVEELAPQRDLGQTPLFQVMLVLQNTPGLQPSLPGLRLTAWAPETGTAKLDLLLSLEEREDGLSGSLEFSRDLFDPPTVDRLLGYYATLLTGAVSQPGRSLFSHPLLSTAERQQILEWNATAKDYPSGAFIPSLFEAQADRTPEAPALTFEGETWSYRRLDEEANRLARHLRRLGVGSEAPVGVALERSLELVLALLAVLKAGGAYVPLDLAHPGERLAFLVADTGTPVVLTLEAHRPRFAVPVVALDGDIEAVRRERPERLETGVSDENLAYILFTSGSTGTPKGAMNTHAGIANRLLWMQDAYGLDGSDSVLQKTPFTFDVSVWEFFWPLIAGARLVMARPDGHRDPDYLLGTIEAEKITTLHFVPSMLQVFLDGIDGEGRGPSLRRVMSSGEALSTELARRFFERFPEAGLHNLYGPTEAAVDVTAWACTPEMAGASVPIGRPISNIVLRILDRAAGLAPAGAPGELCIGGVGLARGYGSRPDLTAAAFVPDPEGNGARLYRTGDLARYRPDGAIEYLGRIDHQVKIRGVRIEPGEIEAVLARHPGIKDGAVGIQEAPGGDKRLVAYVVAANGDLSQEGLRSYLRDRLPEAMVPAAFVVLPALPLTPNGKLDRRALSALGAGAAPARRASAPPRTATEEAIAAAWREVLGAGSVGVDDNFFDLGGHSLLLVKAHRLLRERFPEVTVLDLFRYPTVGALAQFLTREKVDQISLAESRERGEARADRARRQKELRRQVVRDPSGRKKR